MILGSYLATGAVIGQPAYLFAGRFFTGIGVGTLSAIGYVSALSSMSEQMLTLLLVLYTMPSLLHLKFAAFLLPCSNSLLPLASFSPTGSAMEHRTSMAATRNGLGESLC